MSGMKSSSPEFNALLKEANEIFKWTLSSRTSQPNAITYYAYLKIIENIPECRDEFITLLCRSMVSEARGESGVLPTRRFRPNHLVMADIKSTRTIRAVLYIYFHVVAETLQLKFAREKKINADGLSHI
jgi:hypothetical protein